MMGDQVLRDRGGSILGEIRKRYIDDTQVGVVNGSVVGEYDPRRDVTTVRGSIIGKGNLLAALIIEANQ